MEEIAGFWTKGGEFVGRQHVVNHIDMLLGTQTHEGEDVSGRLMLVCWLDVDGAARRSLGRLGGHEDGWLERARGWTLHQSMFAREWQQLLPYVDVCGHEAELRPCDVAEESVAGDLLQACVDSWVEHDHGGDLDDFCARTPVVILLADWDPVTCDRVIVRDRPKNKPGGLPLPVNGYKVMRKRHDDRAEWRAFADRICQNPHVRDELASRQGGACAICGHPLGSRVVVHHVDYDHECRLALSGERWTRPGTRVQPDCERCHAECPDLFDDCLSRLRAMHGDCNYLIEATL